MESQLIYVVLIRHHPTSHNIKYFSKLFFQMLDIIMMWIMVLDKEYNIKSIYKMIQDENIISKIPVRGDNLISDTQGKYRKLMKRKFGEILYHERNKTETIFL